MNFNFELILFYATAITGVIALFDVIFLAPKRHRAQAGSADKKMPWLIDLARAFFPVLLIVFILRAFLFEPFRIPSGSLEPTLLTGDFILVNKFDYGIRLPVIHQKIAGSGAPQRGDILVFRWPANPSVDFIKRVIGLPGDHISYVNKQLFINNQPIAQDSVQQGMTVNDGSDVFKADEKTENLLGIKHNIYIDPQRSSHDYRDVVVPQGMYFVMGDNRDYSADSRYWGFVPDKNIVGKAILVWMSWDGDKATKIRFNRLGKLID